MTLEPTRNGEVLSQMTADEARAITDLIRTDLNRAEDRLAEMHARDGWKVLGYDSWRSWATTEFPEWSQRTLYYKLSAGQKAAATQSEGVLQSASELPAAYTKPGRPLGAKDKAPRHHAPGPQTAAAPAVDIIVAANMATCQHCGGTGLVPKPIPTTPSLSSTATTGTKDRVLAYSCSSCHGGCSYQAPKCPGCGKVGTVRAR